MKENVSVNKGKIKKKKKIQRTTLILKITFIYWQIGIEIILKFKNKFIENCFHETIFRCRNIFFKNWQFRITFVLNFFIFFSPLVNPLSIVLTWQNNHKDTKKQCCLETIFSAKDLSWKLSPGGIYLEWHCLVQCITSS